MLELLLAIGLCAAATHPKDKKVGGVDNWGEWPPPLSDREKSRRVDSHERSSKDR